MCCVYSWEVLTKTLLMSIYNFCFFREINKTSILFLVEKLPYLELWMSKQQRRVKLDVSMVKCKFSHSVLLKIIPTLLRSGIFLGLIFVGLTAEIAFPGVCVAATFGCTVALATALAFFMIFCDVVRAFTAFTGFWKKQYTCKQDDHDGPISITWANRFAYLLFKFQPMSLL